MTEVAAAVRFVRERLKAALPGTTVETTTEENVPNGVTIRVLPATDHEEYGAATVFSTVPLQIVLSMPGSALTPEMVERSRRMKAALQGGSGANEDGEVYLCRRTAPLYYPARGADGQTWQYVGGMYELEVRGRA